MESKDRQRNERIYVPKCTELRMLMKSYEGLGKLRNA